MDLYNTATLYNAAIKCWPEGDHNTEVPLYAIFAYTVDPFPPLGISVTMAMILFVFDAKKDPFKFEVNWVLDRVNMTSQTNTRSIWAHIGYLVWRRLQCKYIVRTLYGPIYV